MSIDPNTRRSMLSYALLRSQEKLRSVYLKRRVLLILKYPGKRWPVCATVSFTHTTTSTSTSFGIQRSARCPKYCLGFNSFSNASPVGRIVAASLVATLLRSSLIRLWAVRDRVLLHAENPRFRDYFDRIRIRAAMLETVISIDHCWQIGLAW